MIECKFLCLLLILFCSSAMLRLTVGQLDALQVTVVGVQHLVASWRPLEVRPRAHPLLGHRVGRVLQGCGGKARRQDSRTDFTKCLPQLATPEHD